MRNHFTASIDNTTQTLTITSNLESDTDLSGVESIVEDLYNRSTETGKVTINSLPFAI